MARRVKRQVNQEDIRKVLCKAASIGEFFRLTTMIMTGVLSEFCIPKDLILVLRLVLGSNNCRDVVACTKDGLRVSFLSFPISYWCLFWEIQHISCRLSGVQLVWHSPFRSRPATGKMLSPIVILSRD